MHWDALCNCMLKSTSYIQIYQRHLLLPAVPFLNKWSQRKLLQWRHPVKSRNTGQALFVWDRNSPFVIITMEKMLTLTCSLINGIGKDLWGMHIFTKYYQGWWPEIITAQNQRGVWLLWRKSTRLTLIVSQAIVHMVVFLSKNSL